MPTAVFEAAGVYWEVFAGVRGECNNRPRCSLQRRSVRAYYCSFLIESHVSNVTRFRSTAVSFQSSAVGGKTGAFRVAAGDGLRHRLRNDFDPKGIAPAAEGRSLLCDGELTRR